jgi:hypothetical protein
MKNSLIDSSEPARPPLPAAAESDRTLILGKLLQQPLDAENFDELRRRLQAVTDPASPEGLSELRQHLAILEALFLRLINDALSLRNPEAQARLLRTALQAQQGHARTFALIRTLSLQKAGQTEVIVDDAA